MDATRAAELLAIAEAARVRIRTGDDSTVLDELEAVYGEILDALRLFLEQWHPDEAYRLASALVPFWMATKRLDEGARWFADALAQPAGSDASRARAMYDHGYLVFWAGGYELSDERFTEARALAATIGDHEVEALALAGSARVALNDDLDGAIRLLREAVSVTTDLPDSPGRSSAMHVLGVALQMSGDLPAARDVMRTRLDLGRARGDDSIVFIESGNLSMVERRLGNLDEAEALSRTALAIVVRKRNELAIPWIINGLAAVTVAQGAHERGATLLGIAEGLLARAGGEWPPDEREQHDETLATLRDGSAAGALEALLDSGRTMTLDEGVRYALSEDR